MGGEGVLAGEGREAEVEGDVDEDGNDEVDDALQRLMQELVSGIFFSHALSALKADTAAPTS